MRLALIGLAVAVLAFSCWMSLSENPESAPSAAIVAIKPPKPATAVTPSREAPRLDPVQEAAIKAREQRVISADAPVAPTGTSPTPNATMRNEPAPILPVPAAPADDSRPYLGIIPAEGPTFEQLKAHLDVPCEGGTLVMEVVEGSPASGRFQAKDIITSLNGRAIKDGEELRALLNDRKPGESVLFDVIRRNSPLTLRVNLGETPEEPQHADSGAWLGVLLTEADLLMDTLQAQKDFKGGVCVQNVAEGSVALKEGLAPGDVILEFNGQALRSLVDLQEHLRKTGWNSTFNLTVLHKGRERLISTFIQKSE